MYVIKRDGRKETVKFDKITARIGKLCYGLDPLVDSVAVAMKVIEGIYDGVTTHVLDNLASEVAASLATKHPDYGYLASRISISNLHRNTKKSFSETIVDLYNYIDPKLKGYYLYESSWEGTPDPADGKIKLGVQITPLEEAFKNNPGNAYLRKVIAKADTFSPEKVLDIYKKTNAKPYDLNPVDWIEAFFRIDPTFKFGKSDRFFCSALVAYIYQQLGILQENTDWSLLNTLQGSLGLSFKIPTNSEIIIKVFFFIYLNLIELI